MDINKLRAWWAHRQGMDGSLQGASPAQVLERSGWARSVGGAAPYLTLHSRAGTSRDAADAAVTAVEIHELPSARGCTYVLPASDFALGLSVGQGFSEESEMRIARKLGVTDAEIEKLRDKIVSALKKGPLDPAGLKEAVGSAVRNLGEEGKKKGLTTTLPIALGYLQLSGEIRRIPDNGRLDQQRYRYAIWSPNPLATNKLTRDAAFTQLARRFFQWIAPASIAEFQAFAGISGKAAKAAIEALSLEPLEHGSDLLISTEDRAALESFTPPKSPQYVLASSLDSLALLRRTAGALMDEVPGEKPGAFFDLPHHGIFDRGRLAGFWQFDPETNTIAWSCFGRKDKAIEAAVKKTEAFVRDQLGDARSFSLDSPKSRAPKIAELRKA
ncbi:MAG: winged helix DNA-binding domain-containing protein [Acidobacteria bacterium]|nr:winged helix DNA-binding domain-containing protein [Acidobacteriota bacterium]